MISGVIAKIGTSRYVEIEEHIKDYRLKDSDAKKVEDVLESMTCWGIRTNPNVFTRRLLDYKYFPKGKTKCLALLCMIWQRPASVEDIQKTGMSSQAAGLVRALKDKGFIFASNGSSFQFIKGNDGSLCRKIEGFDESLVIDMDGDKKWVKCSCENASIFKKTGDIYDGEKKANKVQLGHKKPRIASAQDGQESPVLTDSMFNNSVAHIYFRPESESTNYHKREVCNRCLRGEEIFVPPIVPRAAYKKIRKGKKCEGCYWYNPALPEFPEKFTLAEHQKTIMEHESQYIPENLRKILPMDERFWDESEISKIIEGVDNA